MRVCPQCGARYEDGAGFCPMDGAGLEPILASVPKPSPGFVFQPPGSSAPGPKSKLAAEPAGAVRHSPPSPGDEERSAAGQSSEHGTDPGTDPGTVAVVASAGGADSSAVRWVPVAGSGRPSSRPEPRARGDSGPASSSSSVKWMAAPINPDPLTPGASQIAEEPIIGLVLGERYRIDSQIGAGGMGVVYRATHVHIGRPLAVKVLRRRYAAKVDLATRFTAEARVASTLEHPNVIDIIDIGETPGGSPYFVMEYLAGQTLAQEIWSSGALDVERAIDIGCAMAQGLAAIHSAGVVHRDLKPDNVFLTQATAEDAERVKILDFGVALDPTRKQRLTKVGSVLGTPEYMSPEQARGEDLDARSDLYALGVVLFESLSGQVPLTSDSQLGTLTKQAFEAAPAIRVIAPHLAAYPTLEGVVSQLLAKDRRNRPGSALESIELLLAARERDLGIATPSRRPPSVPRPAAPARPRRSTIVIGSGAVSSAHQAEEDGLGEGGSTTTGDFAARKPLPPAEAERTDTPLAQQSRRRPSVIVQGVETVTGQRPARIVHAEPVANVVRGEGEDPEESDPAQARGGRWSQGVGPMVLLALGAALFASLLTFGFVRWAERREARSEEPHGARAPGAIPGMGEAAASAAELPWTQVPREVPSIPRD